MVHMNYLYEKDIDFANIKGTGSIWPLIHLRPRAIHMNIGNKY